MRRPMSGSAEEVVDVGLTQVPKLEKCPADA